MNPVPLSRAELVQALSQGHPLEFLPFWGHQPKSNGVIGASCMSQWFYAPFEVEGQRYATAEHYMMVQKALLFGQPELAAQVLLDDSPEHAKALGRKVAGFDDEIWRSHCWATVVTANWHKFGQSVGLRHYLCSTHPRVLVEASPVDQIWGIGYDAKAAEVSQPTLWRGENLLGFALMAARNRLLYESVVGHG